MAQIMWILLCCPRLARVSVFKWDSYPIRIKYSEPDAGELHRQSTSQTVFVADECCPGNSTLRKSMTRLNTLRNGSLTQAAGH